MTDATARAKLEAVRRAFGERLPGRLEQLRIAVERAARTRQPEDVGEARSHVHRLAGVAGSFGFDQLGDDAAEIEQALDVSAPDWDAIVRATRALATS